MDNFYTSADGLRLYYRSFAASQPGGLPVLCLPGLTRNSRDFASLAEHLKSRHEVLTADLRGRGLSAWDPDGSRYQLSIYVQDVWSLLDSRGVHRVLVVGTSLGALIGMVLATRPDRIAGLVLNDAGPEMDLVGLLRLASYVGKLPPVTSWAEAAAQTKAVNEASAPDLTDAQWLEYARRNYRENAAGVPMLDMDPQIAAGFKSVPTGPLQMWSLYAQITGVPQLVIRGALSDLLSAATVERMAREKPDLEQLTLANRGHVPLLNEPQCLEAIDAFMARYGRDNLSR